MKDNTQSSEGWEFDGSIAEFYEECLVPITFRPWAERLIDVAALQDNDNILDIACGTGIVARLAAPQIGERSTVVGLDLKPGMLAIAETVANEEHLSIEWRVGDGMNLPFRDERFDVVFCQQGLQFFDDPLMALREMRRVLTPGGRAIISVWRSIEHRPADNVLVDTLNRHIGPGAGDVLLAPFPNWDSEHLRNLANETPFSDISVTIMVGSERFHSLETFIQALDITPLAEHLSDAEIKHALVRDLRRNLRDYIDDEGIIQPTEIFLIQAHR